MKVGCYKFGGLISSVLPRIEYWRRMLILDLIFTRLFTVRTPMVTF